ncbi:hypothetical protein PG984_011428 [Apiospora sp. TS-2023a]
MPNKREPPRAGDATLLLLGPFFFRIVRRRAGVAVASHARRKRDGTTQLPLKERNSPRVSSIRTVSTSTAPLYAAPTDWAKRSA